MLDIWNHLMFVTIDIFEYVCYSTIILYDCMMSVKL